MLSKLLIKVDCFVIVHMHRPLWSLAVNPALEMGTTDNSYSVSTDIPSL